MSKNKVHGVSSFDTVVEKHDLKVNEWNVDPENGNLNVLVNNFNNIDVVSFNKYDAIAGIDYAIYYTDEVEVEKYLLNTEDEAVKARNSEKLSCITVFEVSQHTLNLTCLAMYNNEAASLFDDVKKRAHKRYLHFVATHESGVEASVITVELLDVHGYNYAISIDDLVSEVEMSFKIESVNLFKSVKLEG